MAAKTPSKPRAAKAAPAETSTSEARSRFTAALDEARAGAVALGSETRNRAASYAGDARARSEDWAAEAKVKAGELATQGKDKASEALVGLSRVVDENAATIDERLGQKYGDYARTASRSLQSTASNLQQKSVEELGDDARQYVRDNPGKAIGIAAVAGFLISRLFRR